MQFGRCFEEFEVGAVYKHWPGRTITEYDDTLFSMLTMNHNPLHIDAYYAEATQFKRRLVVGPLIFSIALGMSVPDVSGKAIANLEFENVKHLGSSPAVSRIVVSSQLKPSPTTSVVKTYSRSNAV